MGVREVLFWLIRGARGMMEEGKWRRERVRGDWCRMAYGGERGCGVAGVGGLMAVIEGAARLT